MTKGYCGIGLQNPKHNLNVGGVLRAIGCYEANFLAITGQRFKRCATDTTEAYKSVPVFNVNNLREVIPFDCVPVAVDLIEGATSLNEYEHPERAFYIFGAEDATLGKSVTEWCRDVIYVPTKGCMNLAATVNVVLYDRKCKELNKGE